MDPGSGAGTTFVWFFTSVIRGRILDPLIFVERAFVVCRARAFRCADTAELPFAAHRRGNDFLGGHRLVTDVFANRRRAFDDGIGERAETLTLVALQFTLSLVCVAR